MLFTILKKTKLFTNSRNKKTRVYVENLTKTRVWENSSLCPKNATKNSIQEFHLRSSLLFLILWWHRTPSSIVSQHIWWQLSQAFIQLSLNFSGAFTGLSGCFQKVWVILYVWQDKCAGCHEITNCGYIRKYKLPFLSALVHMALIFLCKVKMLNFMKATPLQ